MKNLCNEIYATNFTMQKQETYSKKILHRFVAQAPQARELIEKYSI
jgi:hypothetical protein